MLQVAWENQVTKFVKRPMLPQVLSLTCGSVTSPEVNRGKRGVTMMLLGLKRRRRNAGCKNSNKVYYLATKKQVSSKGRSLFSHVKK